MTSLPWALLVPIKPLEQAKSRLSVSPPSRRAELVLAMACDTVAVALACPKVALVLLVADVADGLEPLQRMGASIVVDPARGGLNASLRHAAGVAAARDSAYGIASLVADVAAVRVDELTRVLDAAGRVPRAFVADTAGIGTTLVAARCWGAFLPEYGPLSRHRHTAAGFTELAETDIPGVRLDVDTVADLAVAAALGVGPRTAAVLGRSRRSLE